MSGRRKQKISPGERELRQRKRQQRLQADVVQDTAAVFTCSTEIADDFAAQCESRREELEIDLAFNQVACEIWAGRLGRSQDLADALSALAAERQRHLDAIAELGRRLAALAADEALAHQHLDPVEEYRELVRQRLFPDPSPAKPPAAQ
jgi:hypothetical protein